MNKIALSIKNRLSLRPPQTRSLELLSEVTDMLVLKKNQDLSSALEKVHAKCQTCTDFERNFPSLCFALATGVGKTRLMGAFISYLYMAKGIKNFFVLAPNLTIYNKLIDDFSNSSSKKYVFTGIGEFADNPPQIITGDNYEHHSNRYFSDVMINIFNISKINAEARSGKEPKIKRLSEYIGDSYFNYLSGLDDLVLLMDESHHYRADRGMEVINELNPVIGLELTATPQIERAGNPIKFKNVVYEYSLSNAITDGFVKEPAVATRKNFDPSKYTAEDIDRIKLEDGIRLHEDTKVALDIYSRDTRMPIVKPFVLVVAKDTEHAGKLKDLIISSSFFSGYYADKVMEIHSNQRGEEKDENIAHLLSLESPKNKIEIVVHVNMLKEGWDVTNLYTIIPLRTAASTTLREQTIGRGLRLPYGKRTGADKVDKLTIVAHDKFQEIIDEANKPDSIIRRGNIIEIDDEDIGSLKEVIVAESKIDSFLSEEKLKIKNISSETDRNKAQNQLNAKVSMVNVLERMGSEVKSVQDLSRPEIKKIVIQKLKDKMEYQGPTLFDGDILKEAEAVYEVIVTEFSKNIIEIPRITILQSNEVKSGFRDFELDVVNLNYQPVSEEILVKKLREQENDTDIVIGKGRISLDKPERIIVNELINYSEIDYDSQSDMLFKLAKQAVNKFKSYLDDEKKIDNVVQYHKKEIGNFIYTQMMNHFYFDTPEYEKPVVMPFTRIEKHNYSKYTKDSIHHFTETITPTKSIPTKVFAGFKKTYHNIYKFDSKTEKDFAVILEQDKDVLKWLRPAQNQFHIYWKHNSRQYHPDYVVETESVIYLIETKKEGDIETSDVMEKSKAALIYCRQATDFTSMNKGKPWKYVLIPHNAVMVNMGFEKLVNEFEVKK